MGDAIDGELVVAVADVDPGSDEAAPVRRIRAAYSPSERNKMEITGSNKHTHMQQATIGISLSVRARSDRVAFTIRRWAIVTPATVRPCDRRKENRENANNKIAGQ